MPGGWLPGESAESRPKSGSTGWGACALRVWGVPRSAADGDRAVLVDWVEQFFVETFGHSRDNQAGDEFVRTAKDKGDQFLLWIVDGPPVSMAMLRAPAAGVSRIGPVFTPADRRGHGYGSAVTAAAAAWPRRGRRRGGAVRRPGQPDVQRDLPEDRLRTGRRLRPLRFVTAECRACGLHTTRVSCRRTHAAPRTVTVWRRRNPAPQVVSPIGSGSCSAPVPTGIRPARWRRWTRAAEFDEKAADLDDEQLRKAAKLLNLDEPGRVRRHPAVPGDRPRGLRTDDRPAAVRRSAARRAADAGGRRRRDGHR